MIIALSLISSITKSHYLFFRIEGILAPLPWRNEMRRLLFIILIMLWSGLAISLMNDGADHKKGRKDYLKTESRQNYRPQSDRG